MALLPLILSALKRRIRQIAPDVIHAHQVYAEGFWSALAGFHPFIVTPIGGDMDTFAPRYYIYGKIARYVLRRTDMVTGDSLTVRDNCLKIGMRSRFELIQNGVDLNQFRPGTGSVIRKKHGIGSTDHVIFYARGFDTIYNVDQMLCAIPYILNQFPTCKIIMARHSTDMDGRHRDLVHQLGVESQVIFAGFIPHHEIPAYYQSSDLYLSVPSIDNSPHSVYEAMACGLPTVVSKLPWTTYAMRHAENTYLIDEVTPRNIAEAVFVLLSRHSLRERIIAGGLQIVENVFSYHKNMEHMEGLMEELIHRDS